MAIRITEDGVVNYENSPDVNRKLFPNLNVCGKEIDKLEEEINGKAPAVFSTASGSIASFDDGADNMPLKSAVVTMEPIQEGSGDPSPENVRPITGRTGLTLYRSGSDTSNPTEFPVTWESEAGTVYYGTLDVVSGKLNTYGVLKTFVGAASEGWTYSGGSHPYFYCKLGDLNTGTNSEVVCDTFPNNGAINTANDTEGVYVFNSTSFNGFMMYLRWYALGYSTVTDFRNWLSTNNVTIAYKLPTPTEIQLTPQEVRTLLGVNNVWSDAGSMDVEYPADTKMYIEKLTTPTEDDMIADHEILANSFFMVGNTLYRAITTIASGATITPGTNAMKLSLSDALNALA